MIWYIYKTTCLITGKSYVGKHMVKTDKVDKNYLGSGKLLKYAIEKYGRENFVQEILEFTQSEEQNSIRERYWIAELKTQKPNGYNISPGGEGGISGFDPETNRWFAIHYRDSWTPEQTQRWKENLTKACRTKEHREKIGEKSKAWHSRMTDEEKNAWRKACSEGWKDDKREAQAKRMAERNHSQKGKSLLQQCIETYGEEEGRKKYEERKRHLSEAVKRVEKQSQAHRKETMELRKKCPQYRDWIEQCVVVQQLRINLKKNRISKEYFDAHYETEYSKMKALNAVLKEFAKNERNNGTVV